LPGCRLLAASFHGLCDGQAIVIVLPGRSGLSDRSWVAGRRQSPAMSQSRRTVYTTIRQGARPKLGFLGSPRFPSCQSRDFGGLITVPGTSRSIETGFVKIGQQTAERIENTHTHTRQQIYNRRLPRLG
jgi:hypothetical protein